MLPPSDPDKDPLELGSAEVPVDVAGSPEECVTVPEVDEVLPPLEETAPEEERERAVPEAVNDDDAGVVDVEGPLPCEPVVAVDVEEDSTALVLTVELPKPDTPDPACELDPTHAPEDPDVPKTVPPSSCSSESSTHCIPSRLCPSGHGVHPQDAANMVKATTQVALQKDSVFDPVVFMAAA